MKYLQKQLPNEHLTKFKPFHKISWELPKGKTIDLHSFKIHFDGETNLHSQDTAGTKLIGRRFPRRTQSLIETITIEINKQEIERIDNYNIIYNAKHDISDDVISNYNLSTKSDPTHKIINATKTVLVRALNNTDDDDIKYDKGHYIIDKFIGWMNSNERYLQVGDREITISIYLATPNILYTTAQHATYNQTNYQEPDYTLTNVYALFNVHDMGGVENMKDYMCYTYIQPTATVKHDKQGTYYFPLKLQNMKKLYGTFLKRRQDTKDNELVFVGAKTDSSYGSNGIPANTTYSYKHHLDTNVPHTFCQSEYFILDGANIKDTVWRLDGWEITYNRTPIDEYNEIRNMWSKHGSVYNPEEFQRYNYLSIFDFTEPDNSNFTNNCTNSLEWQVETNGESTDKTYPFIFVEFKKYGL